MSELSCVWSQQKHGEYSLSTRCIMEMEQHMRTLYQDLIKDCHVCHNIAFQVISTVLVLDQNTVQNVHFML